MQQAQFNMIQQLIRPTTVGNEESWSERTLSCLESVDRSIFTPDEEQEFAYTDTMIPLSNDETMLNPLLDAHMVQALAVQPLDQVLEVGTGSGYVTALLATLGRHVYSVEINAEILSTARSTLLKHTVSNSNIRNFTLDLGDASEGWNKHAPYDAIAITGAVESISDNFKDQLKVGGRLFAFVGTEESGISAVLVTRIDEDNWHEKRLFETQIPPLKTQQTKTEEFVF